MIIVYEYMVGLKGGEKYDKFRNPKSKAIDDSSKGQDFRKTEKVRRIKK